MLRRVQECRKHPFARALVDQAYGAGRVSRTSELLPQQAFLT